ncbi:MAG: HEAT repeat domain-containing protein [Acidobacteriota bacterium]
MSFKPQISNIPLVLILLILSAGIGFAIARQDWQQSLTARLTSGDEEQRFDAAAQFVVLFNAFPNSASAQTLGALTQALQGDSSPLVRALSARAMEMCCDEQAVPFLLASLNREREIAVRKAILYTLGAHPSSQTASALLPFLKDKKQEIRAAAAYALASISDASSSGALLEILQRRRGDEDAFARSQAARGLGAIGNRAAIETLLTALISDKSQEVRRESARSLGMIANKQDAKVVEALRKAMLQTDPYLTAIISDALDRIGSRNP